MSGKEQDFVPAVPRKEKKERKNKPHQEKKPAQEKPVEDKSEKKEEPAKPFITENTIICNFCYQIGHRFDACAEKKAKTNFVYCTKCGKNGHHASDCQVTFETECFFCGGNSHTYSQCPDREKFLFEVDGKKKESSLICRKCGAVGHTAHECKETVERKQICFRCGELGHSSAKCDKPAEDNSGLILCRHCGEIGHFASECKVPSVSRVEACQICGQFGHNAENCPSDMPSESTEKKKEQEPKKDSTPSKKAMTSSDLQDVEQFPSL